ncbi:MAG: hypothetical protein E7661_06925 [Ruminococcaceae bacterium]|nr:hypothetical protein [Oscillospiraceae bacterium]
MKKILCLFLAALMCLSTLAMAACGVGDDQKEDGSNNGEGVTEVVSEDPNYACGLPDDLNFGGDTINFLFANRPGREDELVSEGGMESGAIGSAVYERNVTVEERLKVKLNMIPNNDDSVSNSLKMDYTSGTGDYDLVADGTYKAIIPVIEGCYADLNSTEHVDTSKHYWTQGYNDMVTFTTDNRQYLVTGAAAISLFRYMYLTIYNAEKFAEYQLPDLYETVSNGEWTLDYQFQIIQDLYVDSNGNSKSDEEDFHGFVTGDIISVDPYLVAADIHMILKDPETRDLVYNADGVEPLSELCDKIQLIYNNESTHVFKSATYDDVGKTYIIEKFASEKALMATILFYNMETNYNEVGALSYGIAPMPKFSKEQPSYHSYVQDQVTGFGISAGVKGERMDMCSAAMEAIGYHSHQLVRPAYYETTLSERYMQNPQSQEILETIFNSLSFDFSSTCGNIVTSLVIRDTLRPLLSGASNTIASTTKSWARSMERNLKRYNDKLAQLGT